MHEKLKLFVSHAHEESRLGVTIKDALEDAFPDRVAVFVSSDRRDNPGGERWLERIVEELKDPQTRMLVSLISPQALSRPWISIELGAAWVLGHAVFPLCHSGQKLGKLPRPLQDFGGVDLEEPDAAARLITAVEKATSLRIPRRWPVEGFLADMRSCVGIVESRTGARVPESGGDRRGIRGTSTLERQTSPPSLLSQRMDVPKLHPTGLHPGSLSALLLDFMASNHLSLLGLAAAADVVAADCRRNEWVLTHVKPASLNIAQWTAFLEETQATEDACKAAMTAFKSNGSMEALCAQFLNVASHLNDRILSPK